MGPTPTSDRLRSPDSIPTLATASERVRSPEPIATDRYQLGDVIARGGMGEIIAADDRHIGRRVAIKRIRGSHPDPAVVDRFVREARIQGRLDHPAIVPVYEMAFDKDGTPFFAMKRLAGTTLSRILRAQAAGDPAMIERFPRQRLLRAFVDVCLAIEFAHDRRVIHRDLKPANILIGDFGEVYVLDWGVACAIDDDDEVELPPSEVSDCHTLPGSRLGTPGYMAPEQVRAERLDGRLDVYALGCVLFEILAGSPLHPTGEAGMTSALTGTDARPSLRAPDRDVPPELEVLCVAATMADRDARLPDARALGERVQRYLDGDRDLIQRRGLARTNLATATALLAAGDDEESRRSAMREAGRALALDPTLTPAADLVGRLMLDSPRATPPEVDAALAREDRKSIKRFARISLLGYLGYLTFLPALLALGVRDARYIIALVALIGLNAVVSWIGMRGRTPAWRPAAVLAIHAAMIALLGRMFSTVLVVPGAAAVTVMLLIASPNFKSARAAVTVVITMAVAVIGPLVLELAGVLSRSFTVVGQDIVLTSPAINNQAGPTEFLTILWSVAFVLVAAFTARSLALNEREARRRLHIRAWKLGQLVPDATSGIDVSASASGTDLAVGMAPADRTLS